MFLDNKYTKYYFSIVNSAKSAARSKTTGYFESHHIVPKSLGGNNTKDNLILLTAREHFICHLLLLKMLPMQSNWYVKMLHAFMLLKGSNRYQHRYINSKLYENIKTQYSIVRRNARVGKKLSQEQKEKISKSMKGHTVSHETRNLISKKASERKRKPFSNEYKAKMSAIMKTRNRWSRLA